MKISVNSTLDLTIAASPVGAVIQYPDGDKEKIIFSDTSKPLHGTAFLTQVQSVNIKKNGETGKLKRWMKFKHFTDLKNNCTQD